MNNLKVTKIAIATTAFTSLLLVASTAAKAADLACQPTEVAEMFSNRVHVRCANSLSVKNPLTGDINVIEYVAVPTSDTQRANRFITLANAALTSGKVFLVGIPLSSATNASGCSVANCRTPDSFRLMK
jgi:hypothetical protein